MLSPIFWSNWLLLTASVGSVPGATFVIFFSPALIPSLVIEISGSAFPAESTGVIVYPSPVIVEYPLSGLSGSDKNCAASNPVKFLARPISSCPWEFLNVPIFGIPFVKLVAPPTISNLSPNPLAIVVFASSAES